MTIAAARNPWAAATAALAEAVIEAHAVDTLSAGCAFCPDWRAEGPTEDVLRLQREHRLDVHGCTGTKRTGNHPSRVRGVLAASAEPLTSAEIAERVDLSIRQTSRVVAAMSKKGELRQDRVTGKTSRARAVVWRLAGDKP